MVIHHMTSMYARGVCVRSYILLGCIAPHLIGLSTIVEGVPKHGTEGFWDTRFWAGHFAALSTPTLLRRAYAWEATFPTCMGSHSLWNTSVQFTEVHHCILFASSGTKCRYLCFEPHICQVVFQETSMEYVYYTGMLNVTAQRKQSELFLQLIGRISFQ